MNKSLDQWDRRKFLGRMALGGAAALVGLRPKSADAEPPPETTKLRLFDSPVTCIAPQWIAKELLHSEGFTDVQYVKWDPARDYGQIVSGEVDLSLSFVPADLLHLDAGDPLVILAGSHIGCVELVGSARVRSTRDLKGKTVAISGLRSGEHIFISMFAANVGLDPQKDINWVMSPWVDSARLLTEGKIDAYMSSPPFSQQLRAKKIGHLLVNTTTDKPWSQYFCCLVASNKEFVLRHPVATKRALRAITKAADVCALEPRRAARLIADRGVSSYEDALQTLKEIPYGNWREYDPEDALRFFALRMREVGMIKSSPQKIIAEGTDWRFLSELKRELKG
jgi:NitT/TauT family transport system substrate-binding protein